MTKLKEKILGNIVMYIPPFAGLLTPIQKSWRGLGSEEMTNGSVKARRDRIARKERLFIAIY